uniref:Uncharacterized protein n=1 Tax=Oryza punctata TaxID=4537 RepID=A0A0E0LLV7_ORYPU
MARVEAVVVCLLIIAMDVVAGVLGIHAEKAQHQGRRLRILFIECRQPVRHAYELGVAAAAVLAASHAIANVVGGCSCACSGDRRATPNRQMASFALKKAAKCGLPRHHFLSIGGILCFVHGLFCLVYYVSANAAKREEGGRHP